MCLPILLFLAVTINVFDIVLFDAVSATISYSILFANLLKNMKIANLNKI